MNPEMIVARRSAVAAAGLAGRLIGAGRSVAGGLLVTLPSEKDFENPEVGPLLEKYLAGAEAYPTSCRQRMLRLIENLTIGAGAVGYLTESMHGAGSPMAQRIMLGRLAELDDNEKLAERIAGIGD